MLLSSRLTHALYSLAQFLGLGIIAIGVWEYIRAHNTIDTVIGSDHSYNNISIVIIAAGLFMLVLGVVGIIGAALANHVFGRITLLLVSNHSNPDSL